MNLSYSGQLKLILVKLKETLTLFSYFYIFCVIFDILEDNQSLLRHAGIEDRFENINLHNKSSSLTITWMDDGKVWLTKHIG